MNYQQHFSRAAGLALLVSAAALSPAWATSHQGAHGAHGDHGKPSAQAANGEMADGEVRKVDKEGGKLTLKHGDIKSLDMPPMTMVFVVKDKAKLDKLKAGDKIKFNAISDAGKLIVTEIQMAQ